MNFNYKKGFGVLVSAVMAFQATGAQAIFAQEPTALISETEETEKTPAIKAAVTVDGKDFGEAKAGKTVDATVNASLNLKDAKAELLERAGVSASRNVTDNVTFEAKDNTVTVDLVLDSAFTLDADALNKACESFKHDLATVKFVPKGTKIEGSEEGKTTETDQLVFALNFEKLFETAKEKKLTVEQFIDSIPETIDLEFTVSKVKVAEDATPAATIKFTTKTNSFIYWNLKTDRTYSVQPTWNEVSDVLNLTVTNEDNVAMYRMYNPNSGEHFYTAEAKERDALEAAGWTYEMIGWVAPVISKTPVYRLYNANAGDHHYTTDKKEHDALVEFGWKSENIGWYSVDDEKAGKPLYRQYNPNAVAGAHNFTTSTEENNTLVSLGWQAEGIAWYAVK